MGANFFKAWTVRRLLWLVLIGFGCVSHGEASRLVRPLLPEVLQAMEVWARRTCPAVVPIEGLWFNGTDTSHHEGTAFRADVPDVPESLEGRVFFTAAHVIPNGTYEVRIGLPGGIQLAQGIPHPDFKAYSVSPQENDIGLIIVEASVPKTLQTLPIRWDLKNQPDMQTQKTTAILVGCGQVKTLYGTAPVDSQYLDHQRAPHASQSFFIGNGPRHDGFVVVSPFGEFYRGIAHPYGWDFRLPYGLAGPGDSGGPILMDGHIMGMMSGGYDGGLRPILKRNADDKWVVTDAVSLSMPPSIKKALKAFPESDRSTIAACETLVKIAGGHVKSPRTIGIVLGPHLPWIQKTLREYVKNPPRKPVKPPFIPSKL